MRFYFWKKGRKKDVSSYTEVETAELLLKVPEEFENVLQQKIDGVATQYDECYLAERIRNDENCRNWYESKKRTYPNLNICCKKTIRDQLLLAFIISILAIGGAWALSRMSEHPVVPKPIGRFWQRPVREVIDSAQAIYGVKIILEEAEIGDILCSCAIDRAWSSEDFMEKFTTSVTGLEFYSDSVQVFHIKKAPAASTIQK